jgi:CheY-like chemotaxis protein/AraC-like DNA-binding protein
MAAARRPAILAVDDDAGARDAYRVALAEHFELVLAEDGPTALDLLESRPIDLVLLDLLMPGLDGLAVLERIAAVAAEAPVIVVTGLDRAQTALAAVRLGAADVVVKPFEPDGLVALVSATLRAGRDRRPRIGPPPLPGVLVAGGDRGWRAALGVVLRGRCRVESVPTLARALAGLVGWRPDLVVADTRAIGCPPQAAVAAMRHRLPATPLLVVADRAATTMPAAGAPAVVLQAPVGFRRLLDEALPLLPAAPPLRIAPAVAAIIDAVSVGYAASRVEALADTVGLSASHLARVFREQVGLTVRDYLSRVRIEVAKELLRDTGEKTAAIAEMVGLCDESHLARVFRRHDGQPPSAYRRR